MCQCGSLYLQWGLQSCYPPFQEQEFRWLNLIQLGGECRAGAEGS